VWPVGTCSDLVGAAVWLCYQPHACLVVQQIAKSGLHVSPPECDNAAPFEEVVDGLEHL
jgi:hypothetical protein